MISYMLIKNLKAVFKSLMLMWIVSSPTESGQAAFLVEVPGILLEALPQSPQRLDPIQANGLRSSLAAYCSEDTGFPVPLYGAS